MCLSMASLHYKVDPMSLNDLRSIVIWLQSVELSIQRVRDRVSQGGHDVAELVLRRRFGRSLSNFARFYRPLSTAWTVLDNSGVDPEIIARGSGEVVQEVANELLWEKFCRCAK